MALAPSRLLDDDENGWIDGDDLLCTGSLVAPNVFRTAAHCIVTPCTPAGSQLSPANATNGLTSRRLPTAGYLDQRAAKGALSKALFVDVGDRDGARRTGQAGRRLLRRLRRPEVPGRRSDDGPRDRDDGRRELPRDDVGGRTDSPEARAFLGPR